MTTPAKVHSSEAIEAVRVALIAFVDRVTDALGELSAELRRMMEWLEHDRPRYWANQMRLAVDEEHEAQQALRRCLMFPIADERPSCYEERMVLKKAQARLEYCREKVDRVRRWQSAFQHELFEYDGRISQLVRVVDVEVPRAIGVLERILRNLEEYQSLRATNPRAAYNDVAVARTIWSDDTSAPNAADGSSADSNTSGENPGADGAADRVASPAKVTRDENAADSAALPSPTQE